MKVLTILQAVLYMNDSESMDIVDFREYDDRSPYNFLKDFFGVSGENNIKGNFTIGRWNLMSSLSLMMIQLSIFTKWMINMKDGNGETNKLPIKKKQYGSFH